MGASADELTGLVNSPEPFSQSVEELRALQVAALNERLEERSEQIPAVGHRRRELGLERGYNRLWKDGGLLYAPPYR